MWEEYLVPTSVEQALQWLIERGGEARIMAGGTDLVLQAHEGKFPAKAIVDITRIPGLDFLEEREGYIHIGAQVTHARAAASPLLRHKANVLAQACSVVAGPAIRNVGTLVGNIVTALPAGDAAIALSVLEADVEVARPNGERFWTPIADMYQGVGVCSVNSCVEMVVSLRFRPLQPHENGAFRRLSPRRALSLPILNLAVVAGVQEGRFTGVNIAIGPVAVQPFRPAEAESWLVGQPATLETIHHAAELAAAAAKPRDSILRGSAFYRKAQVAVLLRRALAEAARIEEGEAA